MAPPKEPIEPKPDNRIVFKIYDTISGRYLDYSEYHWVFRNKTITSFTTRAAARQALVRYLQQNFNNIRNRDFQIVKVKVVEEIKATTKMDEVAEFMEILLQLRNKYDGDKRFKDHNSFRSSILMQHLSDIQSIFDNGKIGNFTHMIFWKRYWNNNFIKAAGVIKEFSIPKGTYKIRRADAGSTIAFSDPKYAALVKLSADFTVYSYEFKKGASIA